MFELFNIYVVFFFEGENAAKEFLESGDIELSLARKLILAPRGAQITAEYISADTGIIAPIMLIYSLDELEPISLGEIERRLFDSAS